MPANLRAQVPIYFFTERTTLSGYLGTFFHGIVESAAICSSLSPTRLLPQR